ncbi:poly(3-hydroxybutyrate) depolymerase [Niveibacterium sp. SC-1]|uniref:extracellular catalytic domain type 2 short-chain-length polyhydroxyalkanoate depolymerase n=1 Tax=Niveibacterium sp. SC-1 TaxID=3135646 RepID=UPI00311D93BA
MPIKMRLTWKRAIALCSAGISLLLAAATQAETLPPLPALNIDLRETSVSGISSGGFMAVQFQIAHASIVKGAGVVAAGPYYCAEGSVSTATTVCTCTLDPAHKACNPPAADSAMGRELADITRRFAAEGRIDDPSAVARQRVLSFSGGVDHTVPAPVVTQLGRYYAALGMPAANLRAVSDPAAGHAMPTTDFGGACGVSEEPYINRCKLDAAKEILGWIYGPLAEPARRLSSKPRHVDQERYVPDGSGFLWTSGLDSSAWVYVPAECARGARCRLHIALHGCRQGQSYVPLHPVGGATYYGTTFVEHAGYNRWADTNRIVMLYPQATSVPFRNPNGCWDWWGYTGSHYADREGVQIATLRAMAERLSAGFKP